jgi:hypothetical protein
MQVIIRLSHSLHHINFMTFTYGIWYFREKLNIYGCDREFRKVFPQDLEQRMDFFQVYTDPFLINSYAMYAQPAMRLTSIQASCQLYLKLGCAFVAKVDSSKRASVGWLKYLSDNEDKIKGNFLQPIETIVEFISEYTGIHAMHAILGNFEHFLISISIITNAFLQKTDSYPRGLLDILLHAY